MRPRPPDPDRVNTQAELTYLRAGVDPPWERPHLNGQDITDDPDAQTPYQRERRGQYLERVERYRAEGLI